MLLKKQLLSADNLNSAFLSKTATGEQTIDSNLRLGGVLTLKTGGSLISDNFNPSSMQIDPQGSHIVIFDGANNQKLSVYSSDGSKATYLTALSSENYGLLDVAGVDRLEINTNSGKRTRFGGEVTIDGTVSVGKGTPLRIGASDYPNRAFLSIRGTGSSVSGQTTGVLELSDSAADANGRHIGLIQASDQFSTIEKRVAGIGFWSDGTTANNRGGAITFHTKDNAGTSWVERMRIDQGGRVGIGLNVPTYPLQVQVNGTNWGFAVGDRTKNLLRIGSGADGAVIQSVDSASVSTQLFINRDGGNVAIGQPVAAQRLDVNGNIRANNSTFIAGDGAGVRAIQGANTNDSISISSIGNAIWFRNRAGLYSFQAGDTFDHWSRSFQFYQPPAITDNAHYFEIGQRAYNTGDGKYRGIRIVKAVAGTIVDGDLRAGNIYATAGFVLPVGPNQWVINGA